jgi:hypothetical protein
LPQEEDIERNKHFAGLWHLIKRGDTWLPQHPKKEQPKIW